MAAAGIAVGLSGLTACGSAADEEPVQMGEPLVEHSERALMGSLAVPPEQPLMGKIAPPEEIE